MDDDELIARLAGGDDTALRELFSRHAPWLAARLRTRLPAADVEDVLQETFLAVWRGAAAYRPQEQGSGGGWLWGIARRQAAMWLRRQGRIDAARMDATRDDAVRNDAARIDAGFGDAAFLDAPTTPDAPPNAPPGAASDSASDPATGLASGSTSSPTPGTTPGSTLGSARGAAVPRRFDRGWSDPPSAQDAEAAAIARTDLAAAVESLGPPGGPERDVWQLLYVEDRPVAQVADLLGVPEGTVKSRGHRARRLLKAALLGRPPQLGSMQGQPAQGESAQSESTQHQPVQRQPTQSSSTQRSSTQRQPRQGGAESL